MYFSSRRTPASAEATILSIAIYNTIFGVAGATLVHFYYDGSKSTNYAIVGGITFYIIFMTLLLILIMKVCFSSGKIPCLLWRNNTTFKCPK